MLDTVGGEIERWGRERSGGVVAMLWLITAAKLVIAAAPLVMTGLAEGRLPRDRPQFVTILRRQRDDAAHTDRVRTHLYDELIRVIDEADDHRREKAASTIR